MLVRQGWQLIKNLVSESEAWETLNIPIYSVAKKDFLVSHHFPKGAYMVKYGYQQAWEIVKMR